MRSVLDGAVAALCCCTTRWKHGQLTFAPSAPDFGTMSSGYVRYSTVADSDRYGQIDNEW
jgi:hypothetical protein